MPFTSQVTIRFHHTDPAGIVYFAKIFELFHTAFEDLLAEAGHPLSAFFEHGRPEWLMPLVHAEADFRRPLRLGETLEVRVVVDPVDDSRLAFDFEIWGADGLRATGRHVHRAIKAATFKPTSVPADFLAALEKESA